MTQLTVAHPLPLDEHPVSVYLAGLNTASGRRTMRQALDSMAGVLLGTPDAFACNWHALRFQHVMAIRAHLIEAYAPATVNKYLSALRGVLKAAWLLGQMSAEDYHKAVSVQGTNNKRLPSGRELTENELASLLWACQQDDSVTGIRDRAILVVLYTTGLRRAELVELNTTDYIQSESRLVVRGKGGKERDVWLNAASEAALRVWLQVRGTSQGALFQAISRGKNILERRLTPQAIYYILKKRADAAEVAEFSPHDMRRTFVSTLLEAGVDIATVSDMVGHTNIQTTARYDRRGDAVKRAAAAKILLPSAAAPQDSSDDYD